MTWWDAVRDLVLVSAVLAGYAWLAALSLRVRGLHRRLALHTCRDPQPIVSVTRPEHSSTGGSSADSHDRQISVAELLRREQRPQRMWPAPQTRHRDIPAITNGVDPTAPDDQPAPGRT